MCILLSVLTMPKIINIIGGLKMFVIKTHSMGSRIMLRGLGIGCRSGDSPLVWTNSKSSALTLSYEECASVISFIVDVICYELDGDLYISEV